MNEVLLEIFLGELVSEDNDQPNDLIIIKE